MIKIALIDDHVVLRKSLAVLIRLINDFEIVIQADNGADFIQQLKTAGDLPDIVLLDINMPEMGGVETARWLKIHQPQIKVVVLTMLKNEHLVVRMLKSGAKAYLLKDTDPDELKRALKQVYSNGYYHNELTSPAIKRQKEIEKLKEMQLSSQELIFIRWACTEKTYKEIADEMNISPRTVDGYRDALFRKLNVSSRVGIAVYAVRNNLVN